MPNIIVPRRDVYVLSGASVVGSMEKEGPLGTGFDIALDGDDRFGKDTWEKAESETVRLAMERALEIANLADGEIGMILAGDLNNQCIGSGYGLLSYKCPYLGLYGACSTFAEGMLLASLLCGSYVSRAAAVASSHNSTAERQFRFPVEYGGQRTPSSQWTVTGAGAVIITAEREDFAKKRGIWEYLCKITAVMPGHVLDYGITDMGNMGAAMAPAAADTLIRYFRESGTAGADYDLILTGDLGAVGTSILSDLLDDAGYGTATADCGLMIYDRERQDVHAGGSGAGCSAVVFASDVLTRLRTGAVRSVLFVGTGAMMSPMSISQGGSIPAVAHLIRLEAEKYPH